MILDEILDNLSAFSATGKAVGVLLSIDNYTDLMIETGALERGWSGIDAVYGLRVIQTAGSNICKILDNADISALDV